MKTANNKNQKFAIDFDNPIVDEVFENTNSGMIYELSDNQSRLTVFDPKMRHVMKELRFEEPLTWSEVISEIKEQEGQFRQMGYSREDIDPNGEEWER